MRRHDIGAVQFTRDSAGTILNFFPHAVDVHEINIANSIGNDSRQVGMPVQEEAIRSKTNARLRPMPARRRDEVDELGMERGLAAEEMKLPGLEPATPETHPRVGVPERPEARLDRQVGDVAVAVAADRRHRRADDPDVLVHRHPPWPAGSYANPPAAAQEPPRRFDLSCDAHSADGLNKISATLRFAVDLDAKTMRAYRDGKLQPAVPITVTDDLLTLRDEDQPPFGDYASVHVRETVDRRTGAFTSDMALTRANGAAEPAHSEGQCVFARYTGADGKPLY